MNVLITQHVYFLYIHEQPHLYACIVHERDSTWTFMHLYSGFPLHLFTLCFCGKNMNIQISNDMTAGNHRSTKHNGNIFYNDTKPYAEQY